MQFNEYSVSFSQNVPEVTNFLSGSTNSGERKIFEDLKERTKDKKIAVYSKIAGGSGDLSCGYKVLKFLLNIAQVEKEHLIFIVQNQQEREEFNERFNKKNFKVIVESDLEKEKPDLLIITPVAICKTFSYPTIFINEYGVKPIFPGNRIFCTSFGLKPEEMGIHIDQKMRDACKKLENQPVSLRLRLLEKLSNINALQAILGNPYSEEAIFNFATESSLYFGYGHKEETRKNFVMAIALLHKKEQWVKDPCIFLAGSGICEGTLSSKAPIGNQLKNMGIHELEFIDFESQYREIFKYSESALGEKKKKVKVIVGKVPYRDVKLLLRASEKESLATGDQSLSEAISAGKHFYYETLDHKKNLKNELLNIASQFSSKFCTLLQKTDGKMPRGDVGRRANPLKYKQLGKLFYKARTQPEIKASWQGFNDYICNERAFGPQFLKKLNETITQNIL